MKRLPAAIFVVAFFTIAGPASAATLIVDDGGPVTCPGATYVSIQPAIDDAVADDTVEVCAGNYPENLNLAKDITLNGHQDGVDARGRAADEAVVTGSGILLELNTGVAGATVDGFTFMGGTNAIESDTGPLDGLAILNNRVLGFTASGIFLNDPGTDITVHQNVVDGSSSTSGGALVHLDQDAFDGFHLTSNNIVNGADGTGLFSDGSRNVGMSGTRSPLVDGNLFDGNETGANLGRKSFEFATISENTFSNSGFDGLQGGPADSSIIDNVFEDNGRSGLALTGFGGATDLTRGAQRNSVEGNTFTGNLSEALFFSSGQAAGTISTNTANQNNIDGNTNGAVYSGTETINVECNWWGDVSGPTAVDNPGGTGDSVVGAGLDYRPWLIAPAPDGECLGPLPVPQSADDCKKGGWQNLTDDQGRPFNNQGDCVSYVATGGTNPAAG